jgi:hypothetical protein
MIIFLPCIGRLRWTLTRLQAIRRPWPAASVFVRDWNGHTALALVCPRCPSPGKTGLMLVVYKALLPRVQADLRYGAWTYLLECSQRRRRPAAALRSRRSSAPIRRACWCWMSLSVFALRKGARLQLERLLQYRVRKGLPTFFIADSLDLVRERAGAAIAGLRHGEVRGRGRLWAQSPFGSVGQGQPV